MIVSRHQSPVSVHDNTMPADGVWIATDGEDSMMDCSALSQSCFSSVPGDLLQTHTMHSGQMHEVMDPVMDESSNTSISQDSLHKVNEETQPNQEEDNAAEEVLAEKLEEVEVVDRWSPQRQPSDRDIQPPQPPSRPRTLCSADADASVISSSTCSSSRSKNSHSSSKRSSSSSSSRQKRPESFRRTSSEPSDLNATSLHSSSSHSSHYSVSSYGHSREERRVSSRRLTQARKEQAEKRRCRAATKAPKTPARPETPPKDMPPVPGMRKASSHGSPHPTKTYGYKDNDPRRKSDTLPKPGLRKESCHGSVASGSSPHPTDISDYDKDYQRRSHDSLPKPGMRKESSHGSTRDHMGSSSYHERVPRDPSFVPQQPRLSASFHQGTLTDTLRRDSYDHTVGNRGPNHLDIPACRGLLNQDDASLGYRDANGSRRSYDDSQGYCQDPALPRHSDPGVTYSQDRSAVVRRHSDAPRRPQRRGSLEEEEVAAAIALSIQEEEESWKNHNDRLDQPNKQWEQSHYPAVNDNRHSYPSPQRLYPVVDAECTLANATQRQVYNDQNLRTASRPDSGRSNRTSGNPNSSGNMRPREPVVSNNIIHASSSAMSVVSDITDVSFEAQSRGSDYYRYPHPVVDGHQYHDHRYESIPEQQPTYAKRSQNWSHPNQRMQYQQQRHHQQQQLAPQRNYGYSAVPGYADYAAAPAPASAASNGSISTSSPLQVEIEPGVFRPLRGKDETLHAMECSFMVRTNCMACTTIVTCIADAEYVLCPMCKTVGPIEGHSGNGGGVGLGVLPTC